MPRQARRKSESGIYHIILRGINQQQIFEDEEDNLKFLETLKKYKEISGYKIFAYCLMSNHVHLILKVEKEDIVWLLSVSPVVMFIGIIGNITVADIYLKTDSKASLSKMTHIFLQ